MHSHHFWHFGNPTCDGQHGFAGRRGQGRGGPFPRNPFGGGPFGGNPFGGNPFSNFSFLWRGGRARKGDVRAAILVLLAEQPRNGYQLMQEIEQRSEGAWRPSPGSMYPALQQLEDEVLVRVEASDGGRVYHLTDAGKEKAKEHAEAPPWEGADGDEREAAHELRHLIGQVAIAAVQVSRAGNAAQVGDARRILKEARRALYRVLSEDDPEGEE